MDSRKQTEKTIYDLELGDVFSLDEYAFLRRVPGGWIYHSQAFKRDERNGAVIDIQECCTFIPYSTEFHPDVVKTRELREKQEEKMRRDDLLNRP